MPALSFQCATGNDAIEVEIHSSAGHALTRFTARGTHSLDVRFPAGDYTATLRWDDGRTVTKHVRLDMSGATLAIP